MEHGGKPDGDQDPGKSADKPPPRKPDGDQDPGKSADKPPLGKPDDKPPPPAIENPDLAAPLPDTVTRDQIQRLILQLQSKANGENERIAAARALKKLGEKAKDASRALCATLLEQRYRNLQAEAVEALEKVNPAISQLVIPLLRDRPPLMHAEILQRLTALGPDGNVALPVLLYYRLNRANTPEVIQTLAAVAADDKKMTKDFARWLPRENDPLTRAALARSLGHMEGGRDYVPLLISLVRTDLADPVRAAAAEALGEFGPDAKSAIKYLKVLKTDGADSVRRAAEEALKRIAADP
jgi:HEAT repeat protein